MNIERLGTRVCQLEYKLNSIDNQIKNISARVALCNKKTNDLNSSRKHYLKVLQQKHCSAMGMMNRVRALQFPAGFWKRIIQMSDRLDKLNFKGPKGNGKKYVLYLPLYKIRPLMSFIERDKRFGRPNIKKDYQIVYLTPWQKRKLVRMLNGR